MNRMLCALTAGAAALVLTRGFSGAAGHTRPNEKAPSRASENQSGDPGAVRTAPEQANQGREYVAALKKRDSLKGGEKQKCVESAQTKFSRM